MSKCEPKPKPDPTINPNFNLDVAGNPSGKIELSVTHDGKQWATVTLDTAFEVRRTIYALQVFLNTVLNRN